MHVTNLWTRKHHRPNWTAGLALVSAFALAACGSTTTTAPSSGGAKATGLLAQVEKSHQVTIAMSAYAPEDFQSSNGTWTGYDVKILDGFAKSLGAKLVINPMPFAASIEAVTTHREDLTIDIYYTATRAKVIAYSRPMLNYNDAVAVNATHPQVRTDTLAALSGKKTAVVIGSEEVTEAKKIPHANVVQYSNIEDSFLALSSGRVAADLQPGVDIAWTKHTNPSLDIKILGAVPASIAPPIASLRGYYGVPKGSYGSQFLTKLNSYLHKIECNGTEQKILNQFGMTNSIYLHGICAAPNAYAG